jgi:alkaline phosphatase D
MQMRYFFAVARCCLLAAILSAGLGLAQDPTPVIVVPNPPNSATQQAKHYVVLVSLDGLRYDYPRRYGAPHLLQLGFKGASAPEGMFPAYPSLTFPNHISIVTGLYPEHHGIVANSFWDPARKQTYVYSQPQSNSDGSWYSGTPLWILAEQQGMRSACLFWPGSEAEIQDKRPSYYLHFDDKLDDEKRVDQIVAWLKLPPELRPHFVTLYYSNVDHAGHIYGPDSEEVRAAVHHVDAMVGDLVTKIAPLHLPVDFVVVADHGMVALREGLVTLSDSADLSDFHTQGTFLYPKPDADVQETYEEFLAHPDPRFKVYRRADMPAYLHFDANSRAGDPVIVPAGPFRFRAVASAPEGEGADKYRGAHGYNPRTMPEMKAIFFAAGPDIRPGVQLKPFENVNIYPFLAEILGLEPPAVDGTLDVLRPALKASHKR